MIESVHSDDEPEGNGDDADGSRDDTPQPPIICCRGFERHHFFSLHAYRQRVQLHLVHQDTYGTSWRNVDILNLATRGGIDCPMEARKNPARLAKPTW
jgi:hypothetical protein